MENNKVKVNIILSNKTHCELCKNLVTECDFTLNETLPVEYKTTLTP